MRLLRASFAIVCCCLGVFAGPAYAADLHLDGFCLLPEAIVAANTDLPFSGCPAGSGADRIILSWDQWLVAVDNDTDGPNGTPSVTSEITIVGNGYKIRRNSTSAPPLRLFHVGLDGDLTLNNVEIWQGLAPQGGAVYNKGVLTVVDSSFVNNSAEGTASFGSTGGGAIYNRRVAFIYDTSFGGNTTTWTGGAIKSGEICVSGFCWMSVNSSEFHLSSATHGGAIRNTGPGVLNLVEVDIRENTSSSDGGGIWNSGLLTVTSSLLRDNTATRHGGAIHNEGTFASTIANSTLSGNTAFTAGAIKSFGGLTVRMSTLWGNEATDTDPFHDPVAGILAIENISNPTQLERSIVGGCIGGYECSPSHIVDLGNNRGCGSPAAFGVDDLLLNNGGPLRTHQLFSYSTAIDAGGTCPLAKDMRGVPRNTPCDTGAFEFGRCEDDVYAGVTVDGYRVIQICEYFWIYATTVVAPEGDLVLRAGEMVSLGEDFVVESGADLTIEITPWIMP
ncbi:MAG: hypothetical protein GY769_26065 [bacterium]|nr:hypothetical protein [bacterium]